MEISRYFATFGVKVDPKELAKVDRQLQLIDRKIRRWSKRSASNPAFKLSNFAVDQVRLKRVLGNALDIASRQVVFEVSRFNVNRRALRSELLRAGRAERGMVAAGMGGPVGGGGALGRPFATGMGAGMGMRYGMYGMMGGAVGYGAFRGLGAINRTNQEVVAAGLTTRAVANVGGYSDKVGDKSFEWLQQQGNRLGFNWLENSQSYNTFMSNALGAGKNMEQGQEIFRGFSEYSRAMGVTKARNKLVMTALGQMMGKQTLSMEELKRQMSESLPGAIPRFAEAYQQMLADKGEGGDLTGQAAIEKLITDTSAGNIVSSDLLPYVARLMSEKAAPKLQLAMKTAAAEQARFENALLETAELVSPKIESATFRFFNTLKTGLNDSSELAQGLAGAVDILSMTFSSFMGNVTTVGQGLGTLYDMLGDNKKALVAFGGVAVAMLVPFMKWAVVIAGISLALDDLIHTIRGTKEFTFFGNLLGMFDEKIANIRRWFLGNKRENARQKLEEHGDSMSPEQRASYEKTLAPHPLDIGDPRAPITPEYRLMADNEGVGLAGTPFGKVGPNGEISRPLSHSERRDLVQQAAERGHEFDVVRGRAETNHQTRQQGGPQHMVWKVDMNVTGETTEESLDKIRGLAPEFFNEVIEEAIPQFPLNTN